MRRKRISSLHSEDQCKVHEVKALKKMPFPANATDLLYRLVQATRALMVRKGWKVGQLIEFYPSNKNLLGLNVNAGVRIMIRLRDPRNNQRFLPWESLLGTMVHELVHNDIGDHNAEFYRMVSDLSDEVQMDMLQGTHLLETGEDRPFDWTKSRGNVLGHAEPALPQVYLPPTSEELARQRDARLRAFGTESFPTSAKRPAIPNNQLFQFPQSPEVINLIQERQKADQQSCPSGRDSTVWVTEEEQALWTQEAEVVDLTTEEDDAWQTRQQPSSSYSSSSSSSSSRQPRKRLDEVISVDLCQPCAAAVPSPRIVDLLDSPGNYSYPQPSTKRVRSSPTVHDLDTELLLTQEVSLRDLQNIGSHDKVDDHAVQCSVCLENHPHPVAAPNCRWCGTPLPIP